MSQSGPLARFIGTFDWQPPPWMHHTLTRRVSVAVILLAALWVAWRLILPLFPQPDTWNVEISVPDFVPYESSPWRSSMAPPPLYVSFSRDKLTEPDDATGPARIDLVRSEVGDGVRLSPQIEGTWRWADEATLVFQPVNPWPAGQDFEIEFGPGAFAPDARIARGPHRFASAPLTVNVVDAGLIHGDGDGAARRVTGRIQSSHVLQAEALQRALSVRVGSQAVAFELELDDAGREASFRSEPIAIADEARTVRVRVAAGMRSANGPGRTAEPADAELVLPDRANAFSVVGFEAQALARPDAAPEQVLVFEFSGRVADTDLAGALRLLQLPPRKITQRDGREIEGRWRGIGAIPGEVIAAASAVEFTVVPGPEPRRHIIALSFQAPPGSELVAILPDGFADVSGLTLARGFAQLLDAPVLPRRIGIVGDGALLLRSGQRTLNVESQGAEYARVEVARVRPEAVMQLVSQTHGDITEAEFSNWNFSTDDIGERFEHRMRFALPADGSAAYTALDMSRWIGDGGVFVLTFAACMDAQCERIDGRIEGDRRLLMVTDLGLLAKVEHSGERELFVQSLAAGGPVGNLEVTLLGRNGRALQRGRTDAQGRVRFGTHADARREQAPTVFVARRGDDLAFLPWDARGRGLNTSRFGVGGDWELPAAADALRAELVGQRPHYRPGDTVRFAAVIKRGDFGPLEAVPLELRYQYGWSQEVHTETLRASRDGLLEHALPTAADWPRGAYRVTLSLVGEGRSRTQLAEAGFEIDEIEPDRLRMRLAFPGGQRWRTPTDVVATLELENLFGAMAPDRRVTIDESVFARRELVTLPGWTGWRFANPYFTDDAGDTFSRRQRSEGSTDADGGYRHRVDLAGLEDGIYEVIIAATGFDAGDAGAVTASVSTLVTGLDALVGTRESGDLHSLVPGEPASVELVAVGPDGESRALEGLTRRLTRIDPVVSLVRTGNRYAYEPVERELVVAEDAYALAAGTSEMVLDTARPGRYRVELRDAAGRIRARVAYVVTGDSSPAEALARDAQLDLRLGRDAYAPGDRIDIDLVAPYAGAGLITIESDRVLAARWFRADAGASRQSIVVPEGLEQGAYVTVTMVRAPDSAELFAKPLAYAVAGFEIDRARREMPVMLDYPELAHPGTETVLRVRTAERARVVVFGVDAGILQQRGVQPPDPLGRLIARPRLAVDTLQTVDLLLPEFRLLQQLLAPGGDMAERAMLASPPPAADSMAAPSSNPFARTTDAPAVFWSGIVETGPDGTEVRFTPPESFNGEMRLVALAVSERRLGATHAAMRVRAPFVLMPALTTHAVPGDEFDSTLLVANAGLETEGRPVTLRIGATEGVTVVGTATMAEEGFEPGSERRATFRLRAGDQPGPASVTYEVVHGDTIVRRRVTLSIRPQTPFRASLQGGIVARDEFPIEAQRELMPQLAAQRLQVSASPLVFVSGLHTFLSNLHCGCTVDLASAAMVNVVAQRMLRADGSLPWRPQEDPAEALQEQLMELARRQQGDGGFPAFREGRSDGEVSAHVLLLLLEAADAGVAVPRATLDQGQRWLMTTANRPAQDAGSALTRAWAVYLVARSGAAVGAQASLVRDDLERHVPDWRRGVAGTLLAATWQVLHNTRDAEAGIAAFDGRNASARDEAVHQLLLARHFPARAAQGDRDAVQRLLAPLGRNGYDTLTAGRAALALAALADTLPRGEASSVRWSAAGNPGAVLQGHPFAQADIPVSVDMMTLHGAAGRYWAFTQSGYDAAPSPTPVRNGLEVVREYRDADGNAVVDQFRQGDLLTVRIAVRSVDGGRHPNVAITDLLPAGFALERDSITGPTLAVEPGEERVVLYAAIGPSLSEFRFRVRITAAGTFTVPPVQAESMTRREVNGAGAPARITVAPAR